MGEAFADVGFGTVLGEDLVPPFLVEFGPGLDCTAVIVGDGGDAGAGGLPYLAGELRVDAWDVCGDVVAYRPVYLNVWM